MLNFKKKITAVVRALPRLPRQAPLLAIRLYQKTVSPDHGWLRRFFRGGYCPFYPSCSEYAHETIKKRGLIIGLPKALWRVIRCNPWTGGGVDLP